MKKNKNLDAKLQERNKKEINGTQKTEFYAVRLQNSAAKKAVETAVIAAKKNDCKNCSKYKVKYETINYSDLIQSLNTIKKKDIQKYIKMMDTHIVQYEIPLVYSLEAEKKRIAVMKRRRKILCEKILRRDEELIASDWKEIGGDIDGAIRKFRRIYAGNSK